MSVVNSYDIGDLVTLSVLTKDASTPPVLTDPTALALVITLPNGTTKTYGWPSAGPDGSITRDSTGTFHLDYIIAAADLHRIHWAASGSVTEVEDSWIFARYATQPAGNLTTLLDLKGYLNVANDGDDWILQRLLTSASSFVQQWLNWASIVSASWTETRSGQGGNQMMMKNPFITAVTSLTIDGVAIPASTGPTKNGYTFDDRSIYLRGYCFTRGNPMNVAIQYTAGLVAVPPDIAQACIDLIGKKYRQRSRIDMTSETIGGQQTVAFSTKDMDANTQTVLNNYRNVIPV